MTSPQYLTISPGWRSELSPDWPTARALAFRWSLTADTIVKVGRRQEGSKCWTWTTLATYNRIEDAA